MLTACRKNRPGPVADPAGARAQLPRHKPPTPTHRPHPATIVANPGLC